MEYLKKKIIQMKNTLVHNTFVISYFYNLGFNAVVQWFIPIKFHCPIKTKSFHWYCPMERLSYPKKIHSLDYSPLSRGGESGMSMLSMISKIFIYLYWKWRTKGCLKGQKTADVIYRRAVKCKSLLQFIQPSIHSLKTK